MIPNIDHFIKLSFQLWLDHYILKYGQAYTTGNYKLYCTEDERLPAGYLSYSSPFKQWVWDSSISGAVVNSYIYSGSEKIYSDDDNVILDYDNGRAIIKTDNQNLDLTADFSYKDFNIYPTNQTEEDLVVQNKFQENSRYYIQESGIKPYDCVTPAIFINFEEREGVPFALGGMDDVKYYIKAIIVAENDYQLDGINGLLGNCAQRIFPLITGINREDIWNDSINSYSGASYPFGSNWNIVSGGYNYNFRVLKELNDRKLDYCLINKSKCSKVSAKLRENLDLSTYVGFVDFEISNIYFPRIYS